MFDDELVVTCIFYPVRTTACRSDFRSAGLTTAPALLFTCVFLMKLPLSKLNAILNSSPSNTRIYYGLQQTQTPSILLAA